MPTSENRSKILLTVGIPTYNRADKLNEVLGLLSEEEISEEVEIFVSDNCSTDNTLEVLRNFKALFGGALIFDSNESNLGFDRNILKLYMHANGKYIWFLSDDDSFEKGTVQILLNHLKKNEECSLIILNQTDGSKPHIKRKSQIDLCPYYPIGETVTVETGSVYQVLSEKERLVSVLLASQISCCCVLRSKLGELSDEGGGLMHCKLANLNLLTNNNVFITNENLIIPSSKTHYSQWFMDSTLFGIHRLYSLKEMAFSPKVIEIISTQTCRLGLELLWRRYEYPKSRFSYREIDDELIRLIKLEYGSSYELLEGHVQKAMQAKRFKIFLRWMIGPTKRGWNFIKRHLRR